MTDQEQVSELRARSISVVALEQAQVVQDIKSAILTLSEAE